MQNNEYDSLTTLNRYSLKKDERVGGLHIQFNEDVRNWIQSKGNQITVKTIEVNSCCAPGVQELFAYAGKPKDLHNFEEFKNGDITIFIQRSLTSNQTLSLSLTGIRFLRTISAKVQQL